MKKRLKAAWRALAGTIDYYYDPSRFTQMLNYRDVIMLLDQEGNLWQMKEDYSGFFHVELVINSPRRTW